MSKDQSDPLAELRTKRYRTTRMMLAAYAYAAGAAGCGKRCATIVVHDRDMMRGCLDLLEEQLQCRFPLSPSRKYVDCDGGNFTILVAPEGKLSNLEHELRGVDPGSVFIDHAVDTTPPEESELFSKLKQNPPAVSCADVAAAMAAKHRATPGGGELIDKFVADLQQAPDVAYCGISAKHRKAGGHRIKLTVDLYGMPVKVEAQS
jgi:hypothetical protein